MKSVTFLVVLKKGARAGTNGHIDGFCTVRLMLCESQQHEG